MLLYTPGQRTGPMPDSDDFAERCRRLRASDRSAYAAVFEALHEPLFRYVRSLTNERTVAHDVVQNVFVRLWDARQALDPGQSVKACLYRTARNLTYNHHRNRGTRSDNEDDIRRDSNVQPTRPAPPDLAADAERLETRLRTWIDTLPTRHWGDVAVTGRSVS